jgi:hypothetical protein
VSRKESGLDESIQHGIAHGAIQAPESLRLYGRQPKSWHLDVFASNTPKDVLELLLLLS